jgi:hypothetical protein
METLVRHRQPKPFFDPKRARAIGARRLTRAARAFAKAHRWRLVDGSIRTKRGTNLALRSWEELGEALVRSGGLVKTKAGWTDRYTGAVLVARAS